MLDGFSCAILKIAQSDGDTPKAPGGVVGVRAQRWICSSGREGEAYNWRLSLKRLWGAPLKACGVSGCHTLHSCATAVPHLPHAEGPPVYAQNLHLR